MCASKFDMLRPSVRVCRGCAVFERQLRRYKAECPRKAPARLEADFEDYTRCYVEDCPRLAELLMEGWAT